MWRLKSTKISAAYVKFVDKILYLHSREQKKTLTEWKPDLTLPHDLNTNIIEKSTNITIGKIYCNS